jgi:hypothetical protein
MEENHETLTQRLLRVPLLTILACTLAAIAFAHVDGMGTRNRSLYDGEFDRYICQIRRGWPVPFAGHVEYCPRDPKSLPNMKETLTFFDRIDLSKETSFRKTSLTAAVCDVLLALILMAATGTAVWQLEKRRWNRLQFSIADMLSLGAAVSMALGLWCLDRRLSLNGNSAVEDMYVRLRDIPLFDEVMVLFAVACAVWLIVSTAAARLSGKNLKA